MGFWRFLVLFCLVAFLGCGESQTVTENQASPTDQIKSALETVVESGEIDSGLIVVREQLEEMKATDSTKAEELLKDLDALESSSGEQAKAKAKEMLGKL